MRQVERVAVAVELPSPALSYCRDAMFADPAVLDSAQSIIGSCNNDFFRHLTFIFSLHAFLF